jgi:uncharacterized protein with von Willebrand factor type A (vWA) domain
MQAGNLAGPEGFLLENLLLFGRALRMLGLRTSTSQIYGLAEGLVRVDITRRSDFFYTTRAYLVRDKGFYELFERAFDLFWSGRYELLVEFSASRQLNRINPSERNIQDQPDGEQQIKSSARPQTNGEDAADSDQGEPYITGRYSPVELLRKKNFADFTEEDFHNARKLLMDLELRLISKKSRRKIRASKKTRHLDFRGSVRGNIRHDGEIIQLSWNRRKTKARPLVVLCDISGSMESYARLFLYFMYSLVKDNKKIEAFVFGTRLTRITPALRRKNLADVLEGVSSLALDWSGGTRIGASLKDFNYLWARRVLGRGASVIILSDGWDRGEIPLLEREISRLKRSVSKLIWINPLLGSADYKPRVRGIRTVLPFVDEFLPFHNLASMEQITTRWVMPN